jgi:hypothetical protein
MKTLIIFNDIESIRYSIVEGDVSRFNGVIFNSMMSHEHIEECSNFMFNDEDGMYKISLSNDISLIENKDWDKVALITFLP